MTPGASPRAPDRPTLVVYSGTRTRRVSLRSDAILVGAAPDNDIVIHEPTVSRHHFALVRRSARSAWRVFDLGSTNGVWVNGARAANGRGIEDGDTIRIGRRCALVLHLTLPPQHGRGSPRRGADA